MASHDSNGEGGSFLPAAIAGVGLLVVAGLYIFWPSTDAGGGAEGKNAGANRVQVAGGSAVGGGIPAAEATNAAGRPSAAKAPQVRNMSGDPVLPQGIPENETPEERLARLRKRLAAKQEHIKVIEKSLEDLPELRSKRLEQSSDPALTNEDFDRREEKLEKNKERAQKDVEFFEKEIARLEDELGIPPGE